MSLQQVLAPQLQQSLQLLQAPTLELKALVEQELQQNPVLEEVAIEDMEPCTGGVCPTYGPHGLTVGAVEVNQGFFEEHGVEVGDRVRLERT